MRQGRSRYGTSLCLFEGLPRAIRKICRCFEEIGVEVAGFDAVFADDDEADDED